MDGDEATLGKSPTLCPWSAGTRRTGRHVGRRSRLMRCEARAMRRRPARASAARRPT